MGQTNVNDPMAQSESNAERSIAAADEIRGFVETISGKYGRNATEMAVERVLLQLRKTHNELPAEEKVADADRNQPK